MGVDMNSSICKITFFVLFATIFPTQAYTRYKFEVKESRYTRLCSSKNILTVNGRFPGPTIYATRGETLIVDVINKGTKNITIHWHGVKQPRYPWSDGPEYITQCPIQPGSSFRQKIVLSTEEGTLLWHAHSEFDRATVHGAIIIYPKPPTHYPFHKPHAEVPIILGEWWKAGIQEMYDTMVSTGGDLNVSDAYTINGQPGDLYTCSKKGTYKLTVEAGKTYLVRIINAALQDILFFAIANHTLTVVGTDASYTKPLTSSYIAISPGQTIDALLRADQQPDHYYMAARVYNGGTANIAIDNTTTTAILRYAGRRPPDTAPVLPTLPDFSNTTASVNFTGSLRSLADKAHPIEVPLKIDTKMFVTISINTFPCLNNSCAGPKGSRLAASLNNLSFANPSVDVLEAYYYHRNGLFGARFPNFPPLLFNFTAEDLPSYLLTPTQATQVKILEYNSTVQITFQGTNLVAATDHPMHLHGTSFYVVGHGLGIFNPKKDPLTYNLVDPPYVNSIAVPINGWTTIRFKAENPGVWFMHCHIDRHMVWGMDTVFIVKDGRTSEAKMLPPPPDMPRC